MSAYDTPPIDNIPFSFSSSGYSSPDFSNVGFLFGLRPVYTQTSTLQSAINVMQLYQSSTYTYLKSCPTITVGYNNLGIQTIQLPCKYGGIRDIGIYVYGNPTNVDLGAYIFAISNFLDLSQYIEPSISEEQNLISILRGKDVGAINLKNVIKGRSVGNTSSFRSIIKAYDSANYNLYSIVTSIHKAEVTLNETIKGLSTNNYLNLISYLKQNIQQTYNISSYIKQINGSYSLIGTTIKGWECGVEKNFPGFLRPTFLGLSSNITAYLKTNFIELLDINFKIKGWIHTNSDFPISIHGWQEVVLGAYILPKYTKDLSSIIRSTYIINFPASLNAVVPVNLYTSIQGFDLKNLSSTLDGVYGPYDFQSSIFPNLPKELKSTIGGFKGIKITKNLSSYIGAFDYFDLSSSLYIIPSVNLNSIISSRGQSFNLNSIIIPKIVYITRVFSVSLLEHIDLVSMINFSCFGTGYRDLISSLVAQCKMDIRSTIFGSSFDNIVNLGASINNDSFIVENKIRLLISKTEAIGMLKIGHSFKQLPITYDKLLISQGLSYSSKLLGSNITGIMRAVDLSIYINAIENADFVSGTIGDYLGNEVAINLTKGEPRWQRQIELRFQEIADKYLYFGEAKKVYREDRSKNWIIRIQGYESINDGVLGIDRAKVRTKYVFNLSKYTSLDSAIRDMINRVSMFQRCDISSYINSSGGYKDLGGVVKVRNHKYKTSRSIYSNVLGISETMFNLNSVVRGLGIYSQIKNLSGSITAL